MHQKLVYLVKIKVNIYLFFFVNQLLFCNWINERIFFLLLLLFIKRIYLD